MTAERVAIVGSREYRDLAAVSAYVEGLPPDAIIVSGGGARGVDSAAMHAALRRGMIVVQVPASRELWERLGKGAGPARNAVIAELCTRLVAFWDGESRSTAHSIACARRLGRPVEVIR